MEFSKPFKSEIEHPPKVNSDSVVQFSKLDNFEILVFII